MAAMRSSRSAIVAIVLARCTAGVAGSARRLLSRSRDCRIKVCSVVSCSAGAVPVGTGTVVVSPTGLCSTPGSMMAATSAAAARPTLRYQAERRCMRARGRSKPSASPCSRMRCQTSRGGIVSASLLSPDRSAACSSAVNAQIISSSFLLPLIPW